MRIPTSSEMEALVLAVQQAQSHARPRGMPPAVGLLYQPVPLPGFPKTPAERDSSRQRLELIQRHVDFHDKHVLDLGCANGFFLLSLHEVIADGLGVDHFQGNVDTCDALISAYDIQNLRFRRGSITKQLVEELTADRRFDVCFLMSVHHHLVRDVGIDETKAIIQHLASACDLLIIEQGSLTQDEYSSWTGRDEAFVTNSYTRLVSMLESCGIETQTCRPLGLGKYLSGLRPDEEGSGRAIVCVGGTTRLDWCKRKRHKNSVLMEILKTSDGIVWKNVIQGPSLAAREAKNLELVDGPHFPKLLNFQDQCLKLEARKVKPIADVLEQLPKDLIRASCIDALLGLAKAGLVHNELHGEHLVWDDVDNCAVILDFETAWHVGEPRQTWLDEVAAGNPALGLGLYEHALLREDPLGVDLVSMNALFHMWGLDRLTADETHAYRNQLSQMASQ
ncbi:MAG: class I SAM-dependent methyltransferase [bacterium]